MTSITVVGKGLERAAAERASVVVRSRWDAPTPEEAMRVVAAEHRAVAEDARGFVAAGHAERWHADRVWVSHRQEWVGEGKKSRLVFQAAAGVHITFVDFEALGAWMGEVGQKPVHEIGGIVWSLSDDTDRKLGSLARAGAVADATRRAADFAGAAGLGTPRLLSISEEGAALRPSPAAPAAFAMRSGAVADAAPSVELQAGDIEVHSKITVEFEA